MQPLTPQKAALLDSQDKQLALEMTNGTLSRYEHLCDHCQTVPYPVRMHHSFSPPFLR